MKKWWKNEAMSEDYAWDYFNDWKEGKLTCDFVNDLSLVIEEDNKTGCRFLVVDAYNQEKVLKFYERNHFKYLYVNEREERVALHIPENEEELYTRLMFLDLMYTEIMESPF